MPHFTNPSRPPRSPLRHRFVAIAGVVALAAVVAIAWPWPGIAAVGADSPIAPIDSHLRPTLVGIESPAVAVSALATPSAALQREFMEAPNLYAFAIRARRRPAEGGLFYALQAVSYCLLASHEFADGLDELKKDEIAATGTISARRASISDRFYRRCAGFHDLNPQFSQDLVTEAQNGEDPLMRTQILLNSAKTAEERIAAVKALLSLHDQLLTSSRASALAAIDRPSRLRADQPLPPIWFENHDYREDGNDSVYLDAMTLANCRPDAPCFVDMFRLVGCVAQGFCPETTDAWMFENPEKRVPPDRRDRIRALATRMRAAIDRGDVDAFRAPH